MREEKGKMKFPPMKIGKQPDLDFSETPQLKKPKRWKRVKKRGRFWSPFGEKSGKSKQAGSRYYRRQLRKVKRDVLL